MKKEVKNNKKEEANKKPIGFIVGVVCIVLAIAAVLFFFVFRDNRAELNRELESIGREFYENFYYNQVGKNDKERASFLDAYSKLGIIVNLDNLAGTATNKEQLLNKFVNRKTGKKCNTANSKVTIYPKDPYGQKDYTIEASVDCGF